MTLLFACAGAASFTIYTRTKELCREKNWFARDHIFDVAASGGLGRVLCPPTRFRMLTQRYEVVRYLGLSFPLAVLVSACFSGLIPL